MDVRFLKKCGHKFFEFTTDGVTRSVCTDGWINPKICPGFCKPVLADGWQPLPDDRFLDIDESSDSYTLHCPTCFGFISSKGLYRKVGCFHVDLVLDKIGLSQYLYNFIGG